MAHKKARPSSESSPHCAPSAPTPPPASPQEFPVPTSQVESGRHSWKEGRKSRARPSNLTTGKE